MRPWSPGPGEFSRQASAKGVPKAKGNTFSRVSTGKNPAASMRSKSDRFPKSSEGTATGSVVGPGSYETQKFKTTQSTLDNLSARWSKANPGFGTLVKAHELPFAQDVANAAEMPGPGAYAPEKMTLHSTGHSRVFKSSSAGAKVPTTTGVYGDPGAYDPYVRQELKETSKKSFGRSARAGMGQSNAKREWNPDIIGISPGPAAYSMAASDELSRSEKTRMPSSTFRSKTPQRKPLFAEDQKVPGVGTYSPKYPE